MCTLTSSYTKNHNKLLTDSRRVLLRHYNLKTIANRLVKQTRRMKTNAKRVRITSTCHITCTTF